MKLMKNASKGTSSSKDSLLGDDLDSYQVISLYTIATHKHNFKSA